MSFDMLLYAEDYKSKYTHLGEDPKGFYPSNLQKLGELQEKRTGVLSQVIRYTIGKWTNAYAIHAWFFNNLSSDMDNCKEIFIEESNLKELLTLVREVLADHDKAPELLPTDCDFHYGRDEDYNERYFEDLEYTAQLLPLAIEARRNGYDIFYQGY